MKKKIIKLILGINLILIIILGGYQIRRIVDEHWYSNYNLQNEQLLNSQGEDNYQFVVTSGIGGNLKNFKQYIVPSINDNDRIKFVISPGNGITDGEKSKYLELKYTLEKIRVPKILGIGENEIRENGARRYFNYLGDYYTSFDYEDSRFILLDTTETSDRTSQLNWLQNQLENSQEFTNLFVIMSGSPLEDSNSFNLNEQSLLQQLFTNHNVKSVFYNGENQGQKTIAGVDYISTGNYASYDMKDEKPRTNGYYLVAVEGGTISYQFIEVPIAELSEDLVGNMLSQLGQVISYQSADILLVLCLLMIFIIIFYPRLYTEVEYYRDYSESEKFNDGKKLKIAMFTNNYAPFIGGVPISIDLLAKELRSLGHEVVIFAPQYPQTISDDMVYRIKLLLYVKHGNFNFAIANIFNKSYKREFKNGNFDLVHVHHPFWLGKAGCRLGRKYNIPVILTYHTRLELYSKNLPFGRTIFKNYFSHRMVYKFAKKCDGIIAPTTSAFEYLENIRVGSPKIVSPTGVDFTQYNYQKLEDVFTKTNDEVVNLVSVSRLSVEKNIDFIIEGISLLTTKTNKKFKLYMVGDGPDFEKLKSKVKNLGLDDIILFVGAVSPEAINSYYLYGDIFVFASKSETQGMVLVEAMAGSCPIVCVKASGSSDVVTDRYNGFVTDDNLEAWVDKVKILIENKELRTQFGNNAYEFSLEYRMEKIVVNVLNFYVRVLIDKETSNGKR